MRQALSKPDRLVTRALQFHKRGAGNAKLNAMERFSRDYNADTYDAEQPEASRRAAPSAIIGIAALALLVGAIAGGVSGGLVAALIGNGASSSTPKASTSATAGPAGNRTVVQLQEESGITGAVKKVLPGVVTLIVNAQHTDSAGRVVTELNLGSGVVIDDRGYILTNQHVVENANKIVVKLSSGEERPGVLVGDDSPFTDLAVIRVQPDGLPAVAIGDSDLLELGQQVLAIGSVAFSVNAADFRNNVTRGIVSGLHRRWPRDDTVMEDLIQTDAAVNHGNSGGALVNLQGQLVGITTTVVRGTQSNQLVEGVAFAIPSKTFGPIVETIIRDGHMPRPFVGIQHQQITIESARQGNLPVQNGAYIVSVSPDSPAAKVGLRRADIITRIAGVDITEENPYLNVLIKQAPNTTVPVTYVRGGRESTVDLTIGLR